MVIIMNKKQITFLTLGVLALMTVTAGASVYIAQSMSNDKNVSAADAKEIAAKQATVKHRVSQDIKWDDANSKRRGQAVEQAPVQTASACDDGNIAGKAVGGVGGGVLGSMIGDGKGRTAATIAGTLGGAYIGGEAIPLKNATCR